MHPRPEVAARLLDLMPCESVPNHKSLVYLVSYSDALVKHPLSPMPDAFPWLPLVLLLLGGLLSFLPCCTQLGLVQVMLGFNPGHQTGDQERKCKQLPKGAPPALHMLHLLAQGPLCQATLVFHHRPSSTI